MEWTGVYWKPVSNLLEGLFEVLWVNAAHGVKQVPGRKTDVKDCEWLAELLEHGLLRGSFIPPEPFRELRELRRHQNTLIQERARIANRVQRVLESATIQLASVATDILGVSAGSVLEVLLGGERDSGALAARITERDERIEVLCCLFAEKLRRLQALPGQPGKCRKAQKRQDAERQSLVARSVGGMPLGRSPH